MMRYSWADIRPMLSGLGYPFDSYTAENLDELFGRLARQRYDAIVIASNACNDELVMSQLCDHRDELGAFLAKGKGLLVCFQMKLVGEREYLFMPAKLTVRATNRTLQHESPEEGWIAAGEGQESSPLLNYPHRISLEEVREHSLDNDMVKGVYWTHLSATHPSEYVCVIEDTSYEPNRPLLLASRLDEPHRVVVTSLALDWQTHNSLWENCMRFVVEGSPTIAVVSRRGHSTFDYRFLVSTLDVKKLPYAEYDLSAMDPSAVPLDIHTSFILDPSWTPKDVATFMEATAPLIQEGQAHVFSFSDDLSALPCLRAASNVREYQGIANNALTWLVSVYPPEQDQGFWSGSFWRTVEVLRTLTSFGLPIAQYRDRVLQSVFLHDQDGSYDEVLGASCAMLEVYVLFLGKMDVRTQRCYDWIAGRIHEKDLFEQATAFDILQSLEYGVDPQTLRGFRDQVMRTTAVDNEFRLFRFAKTLKTCGFNSDAERMARHLGPLQDPSSGKWVNTAHTASIVDLLISIQEGSVNPDPNLDEMIFRGVQFLRSTYDPDKTSWGGDVSATAKALKALRSFEQKLRYPVDVVASALQTTHEMELHSTAMEVATSMNVHLQTEVNRLSETAREQIGELAAAKARNRFTSRLSAWLASIGTLLAVMLLFFILYATRAGIWGAIGMHVVGFLEDVGPYAIPIMVVLAGYVLYLTLRRLDQAPAITAFLAQILNTKHEKKDE